MRIRAPNLEQAIAGIERRMRRGTPDLAPVRRELVDPPTLPEPTKPWRTREQVWNDYAKELGDRLTPLMLDRARIAWERNEWPWCQEEYLPEGRSPRASPAAVAAAVDECIAQNGGKPIGLKRLWPLVQAKLPGNTIRRDQVKAVAPKADRGRHRRA